MIGLLAAVTEAWSEIRVNRTRVVLSLVGVFLAVFAMTTITAAGNMGRQMMAESSERAGGRPATLQAQVYSLTGSVDAQGKQRLLDAYRATAERHRIADWGLVDNSGRTLTVRFPGGAQAVPFTGVDPAYGSMHRVLVDDGRFFTAGDDEAFSPRLVVNRLFADQLGGFTDGVPLTVQLGGERPVVATVVGIADQPYSDPTMPSAYVLNSTVAQWDLGAAAGYASPPTMEMWVPDVAADALTSTIASELGASMPGYEAQVYRSDFGADLGVVDAVLAYGVRGVGVFALVLGGIGVLNVGIVTVRQRIREIGVRRSFGATGARVFFAVLLESVAATFVAGLLAVMLSIVLVSNVPLEALLPADVTLDDVPPFPVSAAVEGLVAATAIGALAGLVPATMAVRAKVIDAIRY